MRPQGVRLAWDQVAESVRAEIASAVGSPVVAAENQPGGFSPGVAARCRLADGRRCFIKAVSIDQNPDSPRMHRAEAAISAALPPELPVPELLHVVDDGHWVALVFEEVDGHAPKVPWSLDDLRATLATLDAVVAAAVPGRIPDLPSIVERHEHAFHGYRTLAGGDAAVDAIDPWSRRHLEQLAELEVGWATAAVGDALLHADLRADNLLIRDDGTVVIVDWPNACAGPAWVDPLFMLPSVGLDGGPSPMLVEEALDPFAGVDADAVNAVLAALAGYFTYQGTQPAPPGLPTLRAFQRAQGDVARRWLAHRLALP